MDNMLLNFEELNYRLLFDVFFNFIMILNNY